MTSERWRKGLRKLASDRGSVFLEYALVTALVLIMTLSLFNPGSVIYKNIGRDYRFRSLVMKLPIL